MAELTVAMMVDKLAQSIVALMAVSMVELLEKLKEQQTIIVIEHDMDAVFTLADRISVMVYGHIIATGYPDHIRQNQDVQHAYLGED